MTMSSSYESQRNGSSARTIIAAGAVLVMVGVLWAVYRTSESPSLPQPSILTFRSELAAIRAPAGSTLDGPSAESVKIGSLLLTSRYVIQQPDTDARAHFRTELQAHGWQYQSSSDGQPWIDNYCKPPLAAKVAPVGETSSTSTIALSLYWNETTLLKCGKGPT
jgi:hypothetical protein